MLTEINSLSPINMTYVYVGVDLLGCSLLIYFFFFSSFFSFFHLSTPEHTQKTEEEQTQKNDLTSSRPSRSICLALMSVLQTIFFTTLKTVHDRRMLVSLGHYYFFFFFFISSYIFFLCHQLKKTITVVSNTLEIFFFLPFSSLTNCSHWFSHLSNTIILI